ncbi:MAG TPA: FAD-dependent oxidoreductase [Actinomycetota bacterium]|nr:FAD-dependent oxidoreductase [Actinomycetota bacterium]
MKDYRSYSFWLDTCGDDLTPRPGLRSSATADVAIVGAGYTGLWTAYYLKKAEPSLDVAIVEKEIAGFGASGRNGGWCSALFAGKRSAIAQRHGDDAALAMQRAMFETVDEVGAALSAESIDAHWHKGGTLTLATAPAHVPRLRAEVAEEHERWGFGTGDYAWLDAAETARRIRVPGCEGAAFTPHCARVHPARLVRGLARATERLGVRIYERTPALGIAPHRLEVPGAVLEADVVVRATEGYSAAFPRQRRRLAPLYSLMVVTEPLPESFWREAGWDGAETVTDGRHLLIYAQRTADDRIAFGGRGAPYHFGSRVSDRFDREPKVFAELERVLGQLWPGAAHAAITHRWGGVLGVPRDWFSSVSLDRATGLGSAGGYVGDGVSTSNLAGRTLRDLILGRDTALTRLPWVGHRSRSWEPEPLRWLGTNLALWTMASADRAEARTGRPARRAQVVGKLVGL